MSGLIPEETIDQIRQMSDIVEIINSYMPLKKSGADFKGICPFHDDTKPSFTVSLKKQIYKCFACGAGGNVFSFVMAYDKVSFPEAVEMLGERAGVAIKRDPKSVERAAKRNDLYDVMNWACKVFEKALRQPEGEGALQYMQGRGFSEETLQTYRVGFAPATWDYLLKRASRQNISAEVLETCGLVVRDQDGSPRDKFAGRVMFPITDVRSRVIAFGGRVLEKREPKYLNSPETPLFQKRSGLYGLDQARDACAKQGSIALMEGYTDVMMVHQQGVANCVASLGTALTEEQVRLMMRYTATAVLFFDADEAGMRAAMRSVEVFFAQGMNLRIATIPDGLDPFDFTQQHGGEAFASLLTSAPDVMDYIFKQARERGALDSVAGKREIVTQVNDLLAVMKDKMQQSLYLSRASQVLGLREEIMRRELAESQRRQRPTGHRAGIDAAVKQEVPDGLTLAERGLVAIPMHKPELLGVVASERMIEEFRNDHCRQLLETMVEMKSRNRDISLASMISEFNGNAEWTRLLESIYGMAEEVEDFNVWLDECMEKLREFESVRGDAARFKSKILQEQAMDKNERDETLRAFEAIHKNRQAHTKRGPASTG